MCLSIAFHPFIVTEYVERPCKVILEGEGRGMISVKWSNSTATPNGMLFNIIK